MADAWWATACIRARASLRFRRDGIVTAWRALSVRNGGGVVCQSCAGNSTEDGVQIRGGGGRLCKWWSSTTDLPVCRSLLLLPASCRASTWATPAPTASSPSSSCRTTSPAATSATASASSTARAPATTSRATCVLVLHLGCACILVSCLCVRCLKGQGCARVSS